MAKCTLYEIKITQKRNNQMSNELFYIKTTINNNIIGLR